MRDGDGLADGKYDASVITDHPFKPRGEWWSLCAVCNLGEAAHLDTTVTREEKR